VRYLWLTHIVETSLLRQLVELRKDADGTLRGGVAGRLHGHLVHPLSLLHPGLACLMQDKHCHPHVDGAYHPLSAATSPVLQPELRVERLVR
jgi:hypothetical protein